MKIYMVVSNKTFEYINLKHITQMFIAAIQGLTNTTDVKICDSNIW